VTGDDHTARDGSSLPYLRRDVPPDVTLGQEIVIGMEADDRQITFILETVFGDDDALEAVALTTPTIGRTCVLRTDFLESLEPEVKGVTDLAGVGRADQLSPAGEPDLTPYRFVCPVGGEEVTVYILPPSGVRCPTHPGVQMERRDEP
jgi:hypothetical protein